MSSSSLILVVDDDDTTRFAIRRIVAAAGYRVEDAADGASALAMVRSLQPDLVLLDVNLPDISGFEVCRAIKAETAGRTLVMHLSATDVSSERQAEGLEGGADGYIVHPVPARELLARIDSLLRVKAAEEARRESETRYRELFMAMREGFALHEIICDQTGRPVDYRFLDVNPAFLELTGLGRDVIGRTAREVLPVIEDEWVEVYGAVALGGASARFERHAAAFGRDFEVVAFCPRPGQFGTIITDVTERRRTAARLVEGQRLEVAGRLAGGVAHSFNNLLQSVMTALAVLSLRRADPGGFAASVSEIEALVRRGAGLLRGLLLFARRDVSRPEHLDLGEVARAAVVLLEPSLPASVRLEVDVSRGAPLIVADSGQLELVLVNLVENAVEAGATNVRIAVAVAPDGCAELRVGDNGRGIADRVRAHVFEPYTSTKPAAAGAGLGLAVVHGIVSGLGGRIEVEATGELGTTFRLCIPPVQRAAAMGATEAPSPVVPGRTGPARILVVEDEQVARESLVEVLGVLGYEVAAAASAEEAERLAPAPAFDVLLTDFRLPGVDGMELAGRLKARWPRLRVVVMSGFPGEMVAGERPADAIGVVFLQKPFDVATLANVVGSMLASPPPGDGAC